MINDNYPDITSAFQSIIDRIVWHPQEVVDFVKSPSLYSYDNLIHASSCEFEWDLQQVGLTHSRWVRFLTQYIRNDELRTWLDSITEQRRGVVNLLRSTGHTEVVPDHHHPELKGHRWGACFLGVSFRYTPQPNLTLYSRTARVPTTAVMELSLISHLGREIRKLYNIKKEISFTWFCSVIHVTTFDILPYLAIRGEVEELIETKYDLGRFVSRSYREILTKELTREQIPYGRQRRIHRRVREALVGQLLPSCPVSSLSVWEGNS